MAHEDGRSPEVLLPLTPAVLHILLALADGEKHGYAIMREVGARSGGTVRMGPGTLYGSIRRMLDDDLIVELRNRPDAAHGDERRRYYRLTDFGRRVLQAEAHRLENLVRIAQSKRVLPGLGPVGGV
jgi:DNA-binding PadR family transcriptional regulator